MLVAEAKNNLGIVLWKIGAGETGDARAERELEEALFVKTQAIEEKLPSMSLANTHVNLGNVKTALGDFDAATTNYETALQHYRQLLGEISVEVANTENNLGFNKFEQGDHRDADRHLVKSRDIRATLAKGHDSSALKSSEEALRINTNLLVSRCSLM